MRATLCHNLKIVLKTINRLLLQCAMCVNFWKFSEWTLHELTANLFLGTNSYKYNKHKRIPLSTNLLKLNYFLLRFLVGSCNKNLKSSTLAPSEFYLTIFCALKVRFGGQKMALLCIHLEGKITL